MTVDDLAKLRTQLIAHEGLKLFVYQDSAGIETIGCGRNLRDKGISHDEALSLLEHDIADVEAGLTQAYPWFAALDSVRQRAMIDMAFNVGLHGLLKSPKMLAALSAEDYATAATEMLDGPWASEVGHRATTLSTMLRTGHDPVLA